MSHYSHLEPLGWTPEFEAEWAQFTDPAESGTDELATPGTNGGAPAGTSETSTARTNSLATAGTNAGSATFPARVVTEERELLRLQTGLDDGFWGFTIGRARLDEPPAVGDWVVCSRGVQDPRARIHAVLPRRSCLVRRAAGRVDRPQILAANVDVAFVVSSLNTDLNSRRIERYLTTIYDGGARPAILLTKLDLCEEPEPWIREVQAAAPGVDVLAVSALTGGGMEKLAEYLRPGETAVLLGSSGTGKSTVINALSGASLARTQTIRDTDERGRHTTTSRHLWALGSGALIIDTPGMRELQLWADAESLELAFGDVQEAALRCRFTDCMHAAEPGCAVRAALDTGALSAERLESYKKLTREMAFQARKQDRAAASVEKEKWKRIHKQSRADSKHRRWVE